MSRAAAPTLFPVELVEERVRTRSPRRSPASPSLDTAEQLDLLAGLPAPPRQGTVAAAVFRARAFVHQVLARRVCARCCSEERLRFLPRVVDRWHTPVWQLVKAGVSDGRLREAIARCEVLCARCALARPKPQMLRIAGRGVGPRCGERVNPQVFRTGSPVFSQKPRNLRKQTFPQISAKRRA